MSPGTLRADTAPNTEAATPVAASSEDVRPPLAATLRHGSARQAVQAAVPSIVVLGLLGGAAWWGHATGWKMPRFAELCGAQPAPAAAWCDEHGVAAEQCIECNVDLIPPLRDFGWCALHGLPQCPLEHPEIVQTREAVVLADADRRRAEQALALRPRPENNSRCRSHLHRIQLASHEAAEKAGVDIAVVDRQPMVEFVPANGEMVYDQTRVAHLSSRVSGTACSVRKQIGDRVVKGEVLALVDSAEVGRAKAEFLQALSRACVTEETLARLVPLGEQAAVPERTVREAAAARREAQIRLMSARQALVNLGFALPEDSFARLDVPQVAQRIQFLGIPDELAAGWNPTAMSSNLFPLAAPLAGVVVERDVVEGEVLDTSRPLLTVGDVSRMWLILDVRQDDIDLVHLGAPVRFSPGGHGRAAECSGRIAWISTQADERTRTVKVRVDLPNDGRLRANTFGTGRIVLREEPAAIVVPSEAVHWDGCCNLVFVRDRHYFEPDAPKFYHVRKVRLGVKQDGRSEILAGLVPGEVIAAKGSSVLAAQLLRSNLGEGCGCCKK